MSRFLASKVIGMVSKMATSQVRRPVAFSALRFASWGPDHVPVDRKEVEFRVFKSIASHDKISDQNLLKLETHLLNDLGLDSLDHVEVIMAVEDEFDIEIDEVQSEKLFTVKDVVDFVVTTIDNKPDLPKNPGHQYNPNMDFGKN